MREIKFRAWYTGDKYPADPEDLMDSEKPQMIYDVHEVYDSGPRGEGSFYSFLLDDDYIVEQYTGLKDKNGREIYEGDIAHFKHLDNGRDWDDVRFWEDINCLVVWDERLYRWAVRPAGEYICLTPWGRVFEIIGNIHENPELIT